MYTVLHINCEKEIIASTEEAASALGSNIQILSCHSLEMAKRTLVSSTVNCTIADLHKDADKILFLLQEWQKTVDCYRNALILLVDDKNVVLKILEHINFCKVYFHETAGNTKEMIATFLTCHYSLHQQLYHPSNSPFTGESISVKTNEGNKKCMLNDILYIEAFKHRCIVHTKCDAFILSKPLCKLIECSMFSKFSQSHRSFFVNPANIKKIDTSIHPGIITFYNCNKQAYISRSFRTNFKKN